MIHVLSLVEIVHPVVLPVNNLLKVLGELLPRVLGCRPCGPIPIAVFGHDLVLDATYKSSTVTYMLELRRRKSTARDSWSLPTLPGCSGTCAALCRSSPPHDAETSTWVSVGRRSVILALKLSQRAPTSLPLNRLQPRTPFYHPQFPEFARPDLQDGWCCYVQRLWPPGRRALGAFQPRNKSRKDETNTLRSCPLPLSARPLRSPSS